MMSPLGVTGSYTQILCISVIAKLESVFVSHHYLEWKHLNSCSGKRGKPAFLLLVEEKEFSQVKLGEMSQPKLFRSMSQMAERT